MNDNSQIAFYVTNNLSPVNLDQHRLEKHFAARRNLVQNHLGINLKSLNGSEILEFGPNEGQNAMFLATQGALLHLCEPISEFHSIIRANFKGRGLSNQLLSLKSDTVQSFLTRKDYKATFDFVVAEGFLHAIGNRHQIVSELSRRVKEYLIFTYMSKDGYFFESLKRFIARYLLWKFQLSEGELFEVCKNLFKESFDALGSARTYKSWYSDIIINNCQTYSGLDTIANWVNVAKGFEVASVSPSFDYFNKIKWYKDLDLLSHQQMYDKARNFFVFGSLEETCSEEDISNLVRLTEIFTKVSSGEFKLDQVILMNCVNKWNTNNTVLQQFQEFITTVIMDRQIQIDKITQGYLDSDIPRFWGSPQHYVCLRRSSY